MSTLEIPRRGTTRLRTGLWRGDPAVAQIVPNPAEPPNLEMVEACIAKLSSEGFTSAYTAALGADEQAPFLDAGFHVHERLSLLRHDLGAPPRRIRSVGPRQATPSQLTRFVLRRARRRDRGEVLRVDRSAFSAFWRFDDRCLADALAATPSSRFRVARATGDRRRSSVAGYAVTGRAGPSAYLQRLAVDPDLQRCGIGTALVLDCLRWSARHGARSVLVNTQEMNAAALALYGSLGFVPQPQGLAVLTVELAPGALGS